MKKIIPALMVLTLAAACGANGAPFRPTANAGVSVGTGGVSTNANIGATNGILSVGLSL